MIAVVIERAGEVARRKVFPYGRSISIGRAGDNDLVLGDETVEPHHAVLRFERERVIVEPSGDALVLVGKKRVRTSKSLIGGTLTIGAYQLRIVGASPLQVVGAPDPVERELLEAIADRDEASRLVYADWLEHRGDLVRAEFLRVQLQLATLTAEDPAFEPATDRLRELGAHVELAWRARVARPAIENCDAAFDFQCPKEWGALEPTDRTDVRFCGACKQHVFYSASIREAREHAARGDCVALDLEAARWYADLQPPFGVHLCPSCSLDVGRGATSCPACGTLVRRPMLRGRMVAPPRGHDD